MFDKKVNSLFDNGKKEKIEEFNAFLKEGLKVSNETLSCNGALKYSTTGNPFVDDFCNASHYKEPRSYNEVAKTMETLWAIDPLTTLKLSLYLRGITRKCKNEKNESTEDSQRGQGLKNEGILRFLWLAINHKDVFMCNISIYLAFASYKDLFVMLSLDLQYNGWANRKLDWNFFYVIIAAGLVNPNTTNLVRKYLPTIKANSKCTTLEAQAHTLIGRWLASRLKGKSTENLYKIYRQLKSEGIAHQWQQCISQQLYSSINFDTIAGRALSLMVGSKFLENHKLIDKYNDWISTKKSAKFTGFVFELFEPFDKIGLYEELPEVQGKTIQAQFNQLVETGKGNLDTQSKLLVVRDTSGSMQARAIGTNMSSNGIAESMALYFSEFLEGPFKNAWAEFDNGCTLRTFGTGDIISKWRQGISEAYGSTDFLSVAEMLMKIKNNGVSEEEFPTGILCLSDGEFNNSGDYQSTNYKKFKEILRDGSFSKEFINNFKIILWDVPNCYYGSDNSVKFEDFADAPNLFHISGYDTSAVSFIMGNGDFKASPKNSEELLSVALNQELLNKLFLPQRKSHRPFHKKGKKG